MKWAITIDELKKNRVSGITKATFKPLPKILPRNAVRMLQLNKPDENISKCFEVYASDKDLKIALNTEYRDWLDARIPQEFLAKMKKKAARERYELFCGGWVQYHDLIILGGNYQHTIYFDWKSKPGYIIALLKGEDANKSRKSYEDAVQSSSGQPNNSQKDTGYMLPPTSTDPPKPPPPPPPYS